ncbi:hypothetical protein TNCV_2605431 [Trichonephila clavipes]|nr:hypothetical protein TNCV_2605431 [Trichonephila clavipes]
MQTFERHRCFRDYRECVKDEESSGPLQCSRTAENIEKVSVAVRNSIVLPCPKQVMIGVVVRRWEVQAQVSSSSLDYGSKLRGPSPKALV